MAIIFLDIDGPLLPLRAYYMPQNIGKKPQWFDPCAVGMVLLLAKMAPARIVISSNWATKGREYVTEALERNGIPAALLHRDWTTPRTPDGGSWSRGEEILRWLAAHPEETRHCAIDDEEIDVPNAILVTLENGLGREHFMAAGQCLGIDADALWSA